MVEASSCKPSCTKPCAPPPRATRAANTAHSRVLALLRQKRCRQQAIRCGIGIAASKLFGADSFRERFKDLRQTHETPDAITSGSGAGLLSAAHALPGQEAGYVAKVETAILRRFAWADGVSAELSDTYRGGMIANFLLAPIAIIGGIAYLPFASSDAKWVFALFELVVLAAVLAITLTGQKRRWHERWFETRRVAEYLRHAPILLLLGVARAPGRWPLGTETSWPEWYGRHALRNVGLPQLVLTQAYLRRAVDELLHDHVDSAA